MRTAADEGGKTRQEQVVYRLHALLHTMRVIERHEEQLCSIMNDIKKSGEVTAAARQELETLLHELPTQVYQTDLEMAFTALEEVAPIAPDPSGRNGMQPSVDRRNRSAKR